MSTFDGTSLPIYGSLRPNVVTPPRRNHGSDRVVLILKSRNTHPHTL